MRTCRNRGGQATLVSRLHVFEKELRAAGLSENTVDTYIGRSETFARWLRANTRLEVRIPRRSRRTSVPGNQRARVSWTNWSVS